MGQDLFALLDNDWDTWLRRSSAADAMARWQAAAPMLKRVDSLGELMAVFENRAILDVRDEVLLALLGLARTDPDAHRAVLHTLRPGLVALTTRARPWWGWDDAASTVMVAALDRIGRYPAHRTSRVAANLLGDIWHSVWARRQMEQRRQAGCTDLVGLDCIESQSDEPGTERSGGEELMGLVDEAVRRRRISQRDGRLVALHRVFGYTNVEIGRIEGNQPCTIRKRRLAAEAEIAALAVA